MRHRPDRSEPTSSTIVFAVGATVGLVAYASMVVVDWRTGTLRAGSTATTIGLYLAAFVSYLLVVVANERARLSLRWLWALPVIYRLLLLATKPTLSDDVYRYLWDGHVLTNGINPYRYAVAAAELDRIEIPIRALVNNPDLSTPYLPTTQALFALIALVMPSTPLTVQTVMVVFDLAVAAVLWRLLPLAGLPSRRAMLYLWHPLVVVEGAHGAHFDSLMTFLALVAVVTAFDPAMTTSASGGQRPRGPWRRIAEGAVSPVALALAALTRPVPLLLLPVLWWRWTWNQRALAVVTMMAGLLPFGLGSAGWGLGDAPTGTGVFGSARTYAADFRFNAVPATWIESLTGGAATAVLGGSMVVLGGWVWLRARTIGGSQPDDVRRQLRLLAVPVLGYVVATTVLHPWYLTIALAALVALAPARSEPITRWWLLAPWWYLSATLPFSYLTYRQPDAFGELDWVRRLEWYPTLAGLVLVAAVAVGPHRMVAMARSGRPRWVGANPDC